MQKLRDFFTKNRVFIQGLIRWIVVVSALVLTYILLFRPLATLFEPPMGIEYSRNLGDLLKGLAWPVVTLLGILVLRQPITRFLEQVAGRASKLSVFKVEIELGDVAPPQAMNLPSLDDIQTPDATAWTSDSSGNLFQQIRDARVADYAVIDLGDGKDWLTSRIFIFAVMLERMRGLRHIVFLHTDNGRKRSFLGIARPNKIHWLFGQKYPWFEKAFADVYTDYWSGFIYPPNPTNPPNQPSLPNQPNSLNPPIQYPPVTPDPQLLLSENGALHPLRASNLVGSFLSKIQIHVPTVPPPGSSEWAELRSESWEHAAWVDKLLLMQILAGNLTNPSVEYSLDIPSLDQAKRVLRRTGEFVGLVDKDGIFVNVINRGALLEKLAAMTGKL